ncbi:MAG: hypothetical protein JW932_01595 [Deltaproteobacteria bacterium]|nr:hypothetical protein [Deltaproteobacteria bacterium]
MYIPLQYQISEYDCVPTAFMNAVTYLYERNEIPPMVIHHIYLYSLDTVGREARLGSAGTSRYAIRLLGNWLNSYKFKKFSVTTEYLEGEEVHVDPGNRLFVCLSEGGVVLCNVFLGIRQEHYIMLMEIKEGWVYCFDSYFRKSLRGLRNRVQILRKSNLHSPNLKIRVDWMAQEVETFRFCLGPIDKRECLLIWRSR